MKKAVVAILTTLILGGTGTYLYLKKREIPYYDIANLISNEAAFFIEIQDTRKFLDKLTKDNAIWDELTRIRSIKPLEDKIAVIDSILSTDHALKKFLKNKRLIIVAEKQGKERVDFTFLLNMDNLREQNQIQHYFEEWGNTRENQLQSRNYNQTKLYSILKQDTNLLSYATKKGILIMGTSRLLVEQAIRQASVKTGATDNKHFERVSETAGKNVAANLYINYRRFPELISLPLDSPYRSYINNLSEFARWSALDINFKTDALLLNGFTVYDQDKTEIIDLFQNQEPVDLEVGDILPSNTAAFLSLGISNKEDYRQNLQELYRDNENYDDYAEWIAEIENKYHFNPEEIFYELLHLEVGVAFLNASSNNPKQEAFAILKTKGKKYTQSELASISETIASVSGNDSRVQSIDIDKETRFPVYSLPIDNLFKNLFGDVFQGISNRYFTLIDQYAVFAGSPELLREFVYSNILNKTLEHDHKYQQFSDYLSEQYNFHFYTNMYRSPYLISSFLNSNLQEGIQNNLEHIRKFQALAYQFMNSGDMMYNNLFVKYIPEIGEEPKTVWETHLDTAIDFKPALVKNHYTGENEIFVQDLNNKIYLINDVGRILWKKQMDEKIMSDIYQIDFYENGKLQMLFNTKNKIHLIARNGNYVERYPVSLPSPATAPLSVVDYENNKNYRIFIPCENRRVYDYSKDGDIIPGWQFGRTDTHVTGRVQHFRVGTRDYIVFADRYQIYILNRRGQVRVRPEEQFSRSQNNLFILESENSRTKPRMVTTDINGTIHYVYFDGQIKTFDIHTFSPDHHFDYRDVNSDGLKDFIFLDENKLEVYASAEKKILEHQFKDNINHPPIYFHFSYNDRKLGVVSRQNNSIYLLNNNGEMYRGFPLKGNTPFTIGYLDEASNNFNLIVGNKFNFLYNYNVINE